MGTLTEEIFKKKLGRKVRTGEITWIGVDRIVSHDTTSWMAIEKMIEINNKPYDPEQIVIVFDHINPPATVAQAAIQQKIKNLSKNIISATFTMTEFVTRSWSKMDLLYLEI